MDNKEFYAECVKRLSSPINTKIKRELILIVLQNTFVDVDTMLTSKRAIELFGVSGNTLADAYNFIRDNQSLYVNPQWMNSDQVSAIVEDKNAMDILNSRTLEKENSQLILDNAVYRGKVDIINFFMEKDILPRLDTSIFLENLTRNIEHVETLQYIASKNINLSAISSGKLILTATLANNIEGLNEVIKGAPDNLYAIRSSIEEYIGQEYEYKSSGIKLKGNFFDTAIKISPILQVLLNKVSPDIFDLIVEKVKTDEMKEFLKSQYLMVSLNRNLLVNSTNVSKVKI